MNPNMKNSDRKLVLETGQEFYGLGAGAPGPAVGELVFNTSVEGYQEIISDPAYFGQIVVMTYPTIGQYGITDEDSESRSEAIAGLIVRENCDTPSNFRYTKTLGEELAARGVPMLCGPDTRMITRIIRDNGRCKAAIVDAGMPLDVAMKMIAGHRSPECPALEVCCKSRWFARTSNHRFDVVVVDCGVKHSTILALTQRGCNVTVVPAATTAEDIESFNPDGVLISNGPGNTAKLKGVIEAVRNLKGTCPIMGEGLGCEIIALAYGARESKMKVGYHGGRPVRDMNTGRIYSAEHNQGYEIEAASLGGTGLEVRFVDVASGTVAGIENKADKVLGTMFYPVGAPGPKDCEYLMDNFISMMEEKK